MKNGLVNVKLDSLKINELLRDSPLKLIEGNISQISLSLSIEYMKIEVNIEKVSLVLYMDDYS